MLKLTLFLLITLLMTGCLSLDRNSGRFEQQYRSPFLIQNGAKICDHNEVYGSKPQKKETQREEVATKQDQREEKTEKKIIKKERDQKVAIKNSARDQKRYKLVAYAKKFNRYRRVPKPFRNDCSGFIRFAFNHIGIDPFDLEITKENGKWINGTKLVRNYARKHGSVFKSWKKVRPGDLIFFDNTHDKNRNRKLDDLFTHIALVIGVEPDGTIHYIHKSGRGINIQKMNLLYPHSAYRKMGKQKFKVNSYLRRRTRRDPPGTPHLSAEMFRSFGRIGK